MKNKYILFVGVLISLLFSFKTNAQVFNYYTVPAVFNGTSGSGRGPVTSFAAHRSCAIYPTGDFTGLINNGDTIKSLGFIINTNALGTALNGNIKIYMVNTTDATYLKSTTWSTILTSGGAMDTVYNGSMTIPAATGPYTVTLTKPFKYTGGGVYVAYEWTVSTPAVGISIYSCNASLAASQRNNQGASLAAITTLTSSSAFRAQLYLGVESPTNDAAIVEVYSLGKLPIPFGLPHTVKARVKNNGADTLTNKAFYLSVGSTNIFNDSVIVDSLYPGQERNIAFASYSSSYTGYDTVRVFCSPDNGNGNNMKSYVQIVNLNTYNYADPGKPTSGGVGFTGGTGDFVAKFPYTGSNSINQVGVNFSAGGNTLKVGIWDTSSTGTPGTLLWQSAPFITAVGLNTIPVNPPIPITGTFFVGVIQTGTTNASFSYQSETPIRGQTFYYTAPTGGTTWTDFSSTSSNFRFMIEPRLQLANDLGATGISSPPDVIVLGQPGVVPSATFYNYGSNTQFGVKLRARIFNNTGTIVYNDSSNIAFILSNNSQSVTFTNSFVPATGGNYTFKCWSELSGDGDRNNDTAVKTFSAQDMNTGLSSGTRLNFDGIDNYVSTPHNPILNPTSNFTIEAWYRPVNLISVGTLYSKDSTLTDTSLTINMVGSTPQVIMRTTTGTYSFMGSSGGTLFSWTHYAVTYDGSYLRLYVNGDTAGVFPVTGTVTCLNGPTCLGRRAALTGSLNGGLENYLFWNVARTQSQIRLGLHYKIPALNNPNIKQYLRFDESAGISVLADASGNNNVAYMTNFDLGADWFLSSLPLDSTLGTSVTFTNSSLQTFAGKNLALQFQNFSGSAEIVAHYIRFIPIGFLPDTIIASTPKVSHNRHWVIYKYGNATYDSCRATFTVPAGNIGISALNNQLYLTNRDNGASGLWTLARNPADTLNKVAQTLRFWLPTTGTFNKQYGLASSNPTTAPLPIKIVSFNGFKFQEGVKLIWSTANETNNSHFILERSFDGNSFLSFVKVKGAGNSQRQLDYSYFDMDAVNIAHHAGSTKIYYRLNQFDFDGKNSYSDMIAIDLTKEDDVEIKAVQPNPFNNQLSLVFSSSKDIHMVIDIMNMNGQILISKIVNKEAGAQKIDFDEAGNLPLGIYFMRLNYDGKSQVQKLIKLNN